MFFLNLSAGEFFTLLGVFGAGITALYLLDRARRKKVVSTLRFWTAASSADEQQSRKRMREPWSLLLQLLSLLLLLLAIAQLQWGTRERRGHDDVLLIDTSSWSGQQGEGGTILDREKQLAASYLSGLRSGDRVMLVRADGLATQVTAFTSNRALLNNGLSASVPSFSALNINQALSFAQQAQEWSGGQRGEIVYIGPKLIEDGEAAPRKVPNLRTIPVQPNLDNCGIRRIGVKTSEDKSDSWEANVTVKNYGSQPRALRLNTQFGSTRFAPRILQLGPGQEKTAAYSFLTNSAGRLSTQIEPGDQLPSDDRAEIALPRNSLLKVAVFTARPDTLRPLLQANHKLSVTFHSPAEFTPKTVADVVVLDRISPPQPPTVPSLWIEPPKENAPLPVKAVNHDAVITAWDSSTGLGAGLHAKQIHLPNAEVFQTFASDIPVASVAAGAVAVARNASDGKPKTAVIGFDPLSGDLRYQVTTPLLFADLLRWLSPDTFRTLDFSAGHTGAASVTLDPSESVARLSIADESGTAVPFTIRNQTLELFVNRPSIVHIVSDDRERTLSLTLPDVAETKWSPSGNVADGLPPSSNFLPGATDLWHWLAILGGLGLLAEWLIYGRLRVLKWRKRPAPEPAQTKRGREREFASR